MTPIVEEFYNHVHGKGGRFASSSSRIGTGKIATTGVSKSGGLPQVATMTRSGRVSFKDSARSVATPHNFPRADKRSGSVHSQAKIDSPGAVYTKLAGSHTIRKLKNGRFILHEKNQPPIRAGKAGAAHVKMLDESKPTMADKIAARVHRIRAKDYDDSTWRP